jgi:hypothetical protein
MWREEEEVRRSWREGCGEGFDWWTGGGRRGNDVFPAALRTQEGVVASLGLQVRVGRRRGKAVRWKREIEE